MDKDIKEFIESNIRSIEKNDWYVIYEELTRFYYIYQVGEFTEIMLKCGLHPEYYLTKLPRGFLDSSHIETFEIPNNVTSISRAAFKNCENLKHIVIPNSVITIGDFAFEDCKSLTSVIIPDSVKTVDAYIFRWCESLEQVQLGNNVTKIGNCSFSGCSNLKNINIPKTVRSIGLSAFENCGDNLTIKYEGTLTDWKNIYRVDQFTKTYFKIECSDGNISIRG